MVDTRRGCAGQVPAHRAARGSAREITRGTSQEQSTRVPASGCCCTGPSVLPHWARSLLDRWAAGYFTGGLRFAAGPRGTSLGEFVGRTVKLLMGLCAGRSGLYVVVVLTDARVRAAFHAFPFVLAIQEDYIASPPVPLFSIDRRKLKFPKPAPPSSGETGNQI